MIAGRIAVTGSIATDHLMRFPGRFADQFVADMLDKVSLSFLVDDLTIRHGGVAANIAYGLALLGWNPLLIGSVGADFAPRRAVLEELGVDCRYLRVTPDGHTARFVCTTDADLCQIASFYPGAMRESAAIDLTVMLRAEKPGLVLIGADEPAAMLAHAAACRGRGVRYAADPSQQIARMSGTDLFAFIDGASLLLTNEYELELLCEKTGLDRPGLLRHVGTRITTLGEHGAEVAVPGRATVTVPAAEVVRPADPTGVGDAFRAGLLAALAAGLDLTAASAAGCRLAARALEAFGSQEYTVDPGTLDRRLVRRSTPLRPAGRNVADLDRTGGR
jgi:adenosine kinase